MLTCGVLGDNFAGIYMNCVVYVFWEKRSIEGEGNLFRFSHIIKRVVRYV